MKIIITLLTLLIPTLSLASSSNEELEKYLIEQKTEISKIQILKDNCKGNEWKNKLNTFLHDEIDNPPIESVINSFYTNFQWNHCFSRDFGKIKAAESFATNKIFNLTKTCSKEEDIKKAKDIRQDIINEKNIFDSKASKFWNPWLYWSWNIAPDCDQDPWKQASENFEKLLDKFRNWAVFDASSFKENISNKWWEIKEWNKSIDTDKRAEDRARSWLEKNVNSYIPISWLKATFSEKSSAKIDDSENKNIKKSDEAFYNIFKDIISLFVPWKNIKKFSQEVDQITEKKQIIDFNLNNIWERHIILSLAEDSSDNIISELWLLERSIIVSNWNKQELKQIGETNNDKSLNNFIKTVWDMLRNHNKNETRVPSLVYGDY